MSSDTYLDRREQLKVYFDRTAVRAWEQLTSDAKVSRIRQTVRAGRDAMRTQLLDWMPDSLQGLRVLDAGCGTGALATELAVRGADVLGIDISPSLIDIARERLPAELAGSVTFESGDMLASAGPFDVIVAMDSLIHYRADDLVDALCALDSRLAGDHARLLFSFAPRTPLLAAMHLVGRAFPRGDRSPAIEPIAEHDLRARLAAHPTLSRLDIAASRRIDASFYKSQALWLQQR